MPEKSKLNSMKENTQWREKMVDNKFEIEST